MRHFTRFAGRAFTLVELLVVIGIIAVLMAILLPAVGRAREQGRQIVCASDERQIALAILTYATDNRGQLPLVVDPYPGAPPWEAICMVSPGSLDYENGLLWPYISPDISVRQRIFNCPSDPDPKFYNLGINSAAPTPPRNFSYALTFELNRLCSGPILGGLVYNPGLCALPISMVHHVDHKFLVIEQYSPGGISGNLIVETMGAGSNLISLLTSRHFGKANIAFFDGHCELVEPTTFSGHSNTVYTPNYYYYVDVLHD